MRQPFHGSGPDWFTFRISGLRTFLQSGISWIPAALILVLFTVFPLSGIPAVKIALKPRFYAGLGIGRTLDVRHPAFAIEDQDDLDYETINLASIQRFFKRGQIRMDLLQVGDFSFGYTFWGHAAEYPHDFFYFLPKEGKTYPFGNHAGLHAATVQWNLRAVSGRYIVPFILGGAGRYYGNSTVMQFQLEDAEQSVYSYFIRQEYSDEGTAWMAGAGAVAFKHAYVYAGIVRLERTILPSKGYLDLIIGFTI
jgi:hypothetical protein